MAKNERNWAPTESEEQQALFRWAAYESGAHPELALLYHIPNEGKRSLVAGAKLRAEGLKRGVPDICLPVPRGKWHGLYIELKRLRGGRVSDEQQRWLDALNGIFCDGLPRMAAGGGGNSELSRHIGPGRAKKASKRGWTV